MTSPFGQRSERINYLADAYEWLKADPAHYETADNGKVHTVRNVARAKVDDTKIAPSGIYFIQDQTFTHSGQQLAGPSVKLVNHGDSSSYHDYLPIQSYGDDKGRVNTTDMLRDTVTFTDERIARMALNAAVVIETNSPR